ncbi:hypothetical protein JCM18899A_26980 [Nocardioides sp. AN3]
MATRTTSAPTPTTADVAEGRPDQRDTTAYVGLYIAEGETGWPPQSPRRVDAELLRERLSEGGRDRDM